MSGIDNQRVVSHLSIHVSWSSDEGDEAELSRRPEAIKAIISTTSQPTGLNQQQPSIIRREPPMVDKLTSVLGMFDLELIS